MIWKKGKYLKTSTMVTVFFVQSVMEIALPVKSYPLKTGQICQECDVLAWQTLNCLNLPRW